MKSTFRLPGPTPLPPAVLDALHGDMMTHRGPVFAEFLGGLLDRLQLLHRTTADVFVLPGSGSAGWEVGLVNLLSPGDEVLAVITGNFGSRFATVAEALGLEVHRLEVPWGQAVTPDQLEEALTSHPAVPAVLLTHNETSTGITNPLPELAEIVQQHGALTLVDAVSSAAGIPLEVDSWGLDFVLSGTQKAWMCPPGVSIVTVSDRAWDAYDRSTTPKFFWDLGRFRDSAAAGTTPTTPPLSLLYALDAASRMIEAETLAEVWDRHARLGAQTRAGIAELGLELLADQQYVSDTVTAFFPPAGIEAPELRRSLKSDFDITVAGGQAHLEHEILRVGHMGWVDDEDMDYFLSSLKQAIESKSPAFA